MDVRAENRGRPRLKVCFSCGPADGEKLFDPWSSWRKGEECPREIRTEKFMFTILFEIITFLIRKPFFYVTVMENNSARVFLL